jgi:hypothetical protein
LLPLLYYCLPIFFFINHSHECSQQLGWVKYGVGKGDTVFRIYYRFMYNKSKLPQSQTIE